MRKINLDIFEREFGLIWQALHAQEEKLLRIIESAEEDPDSEEAAFAGNDLVYLRLYRDELETAAKKAGFGNSVFSLSNDVIEP